VAVHSIITIFFGEKEAKREVSQVKSVFCCLWSITTFILLVTVYCCAFYELLLFVQCWPRLMTFISSSFFVVAFCQLCFIKKRWWWWCANDKI